MACITEVNASAKSDSSNVDVPSLLWFFVGVYCVWIVYDYKKYDLKYISPG